jgi:hypothetical protein
MVALRLPSVAEARERRFRQLLAAPSELLDERCRCRNLCELRCQTRCVNETALSRAGAGDQRAFAALTDPHRRELQLHCYRILGQVQAAEDAVQETLLAA